MAQWIALTLSTGEADGFLGPAHADSRHQPRYWPLSTACVAVRTVDLRRPPSDMCLATPPKQGRHRPLAVALGVLFLAGVASGCSKSSQSEPPDPAQMVDSGSWYSRGLRWPHDGQPFESENFVVYSDAASLEARQRLASVAEEVLVEVVDQMGVDPATMFRFPADQGKIDLYANRYNLLEGGGARGYYAGVVIPSFDHEDRREVTSEGAIRLTLRHELVHVVEALLKGRFVGDVAVGDPRRMPVWFSEGTAEALSGGTTGGAPRTLDEVNDLIAEYGRINPIAWRVDLPLSELDPGAYPDYYYPMAQLAVEYILDPNGLGKSPADLTAVMLDMGNDASFDSAFETRIGLSQSDYEARFFALMDTYLPQSELPFAVIGLGFLSLLAASLVGSSLVWGFRHWSPGVSGSGPFGKPEWSDRARRGFRFEISVMAVIAAGFAALLLFQVASADLQPYVQKTPGYLIAAGHLIASTGILIWAIRRWADHARGAYLTPLLVMLATGITILAIEMIF